MYNALCDIIILTSYDMHKEKVHMKRLLFLIIAMVFTVSFALSAYEIR